MDLPIPARALRLASALALVAASGGAALGQALEQEYVETTLGTNTQAFGYGMATHADLMTVGSPWDDTHAYDAGAASVYRWNPTTRSWGFEAQLVPSDPEAEAFFGGVTACWSDVAIVGAGGDDNTKGTNAGAVYVFRRDPTTGVWAQEQKLIGSVGTLPDGYGTNLALVDKVLLVSAPGLDAGKGSLSGAVYVYRWVDPIVKWVEEAVLVDPGGAGSHYAGTGLGFDGTTAVIGSPGYGLNLDIGSVQIWTVSGTTWTFGKSLTAAPQQNHAQFGYSCDVSGDQILVGAPYHDVTASDVDSGACYFFSKATGSWKQTARFDNPDPATRDYFGWKVAIEGECAVASAPSDYAFGVKSGVTFTFRKGRGQKGWFLDQALAQSDGASLDGLGWGLALGEEHLVIGAPFKNTAKGTDWGTVYGFDADEINVTLDPPNPVPGGTIRVSAYDGAPNDLVLLVVDEINGSPAWIERDLGIFGIDHRFTFDDLVDNPLLGMHVGVTAWKVSPTGELVRSERVFADV